MTRIDLAGVPRTRAALRRTAFLAGALYALTFASSIPAVLMLGPVLNEPGYVLGSGSDTQVLSGVVLDIINALACVSTAVVLYPVVKRQSQSVALGFVTSRVLEAAILLTGVLSLLAVVTLRQDAAGTAGSDPGSLITVAAGMVSLRDWAFLIGTSFAVPNALLLGTLMYRSRLVPRAIPLIGLVGAPLLLVSNGLTMFGLNDQFSPLSLIALPGIFFWELSLGIYLMVKGFRPSAITDDIPGHEARSSTAAVTATAALIR
jgi:hypothetical protein